MAVEPAKKTTADPVKADVAAPVKSAPVKHAAPVKATDSATPPEVVEPAEDAPETPKRSGYADAARAWAGDVAVAVQAAQDDIADLREAHRVFMQANAPTPADGIAGLHVQRVIAAFDDLARVLAQAAAVAADLTTAAS